MLHGGGKLYESVKHSPEKVKNYSPADTALKSVFIFLVRVNLDMVLWLKGPESCNAKVKDCTLITALDIEKYCTVFTISSTSLIC